MGLAKRIIPCLDVDTGGGVKGVRFVEIRDAGDPVEIARRYDQQGADEITFLDITASSDNRDTMVHVVEKVAEQVFIPLTVGGGIRKVEDIRRMLNAGADKAAIHTAAVILLTSMDRDGTRDGFDLKLTRAVCDAVSIPVIASGGVGNLDHLTDGIIEGHADAVRAARFFHFWQY